MEMKFSELNKEYFTISNLFAVRQFCEGKNKFTRQIPRPTDALLLFSGTNSICYQENEAPFYIPCGALVYVPKNSLYIWEDSPASDDNLVKKMLFEFTLYRAETQKDEDSKISISSITSERIDFGNRVRIIATDFLSYYQSSFENLIDAFENQENSLLGAYSKAYELLEVVSNVCAAREDSRADIKIIERGIRYIEENPCPQKSVKEIAELCGVCVGYFERLFKKRFGLSPNEYINMKKILHIKKMLQSKENTLNGIAEAMGYCDSGYLCRFFKRKTDMTPKEYRKLYFASLNSEQKA